MIFDLEHSGHPLSMQMAECAVRDAMESTDSATLRERVMKHEDVILSPVAEKYLAFAADQIAANETAKTTFLNLATVLNRCRSEGMDAVFRPAPTPASGSGTAARSAETDAGTRDSRLYGHWRHTEPVSGFTTDTHCVFDGSGRFQWWSKSASVMGITQSDPEYGTWYVSGKMLHLVFEDGTHMVLDYILDQSNMVWRNHGRYRFWTHLN
jgi:hypothetical protein